MRNKIHKIGRRTLYCSNANGKHFPFRTFSRTDWSQLNRIDDSSINGFDISKLNAMGEPLTMDEIQNIYFPLVSLIQLRIENAKSLKKTSDRFFRHQERQLPYVIGIAGSVAVGKSTTARVLQKVLSLLPHQPKVELVTTDGFLYPNSKLIEKRILNRKGFPESYDTKLLLNFLATMKSGGQSYDLPIYSHLAYDILSDQIQKIDSPDILIVEGINVLQVNSHSNSNSGVFVSDYFDFSIYVDAKEDDIVSWYVNRFESLRRTAFQDPKSYFNKYADLTPEESQQFAKNIWDEINKPNLHQNILPTRYRADLIIKKDKNHFVEEVDVRKV